MLRVAVREPSCGGHHEQLKYRASRYRRLGKHEWPTRGVRDAGTPRMVRLSRNWQREIGSSCQLLDD